MDNFCKKIGHQEVKKSPNLVTLLEIFLLHLVKLNVVGLLMRKQMLQVTLGKDKCTNWKNNIYDKVTDVEIQFWGQTLNKHTHRQIEAATITKAQTGRDPILSPNTWADISRIKVTGAEGTSNKDDKRTERQEPKNIRMYLGTS